MNNDSHELRELRWHKKQLSKQCGKQGQTIHSLRAELAEARSLISRAARGDLRTSERRIQEQLEIIEQWRQLNNDLIKTITELRRENDELRLKASVES